jgi:hypothetical protein
MRDHDWQLGMTLQLRDKGRQQRAKRPPSRRPHDEIRQAELRTEARWAWEMERRGALRLEEYVPMPSLAVH